MVVAWFAAELCRIGATLHACGIMHTDIKVCCSLVCPWGLVLACVATSSTATTIANTQPDNLLIRCDVAGCSAPAWDPLGAESTLKQGWHRFGLQLIDFGRAVDMKQLPGDPLFVVRAFGQDAPWFFP